MRQIAKGSLLKNIVTAVSTLTIFTLFIECTFRIIGYDFEKKIKLFESFPIYYREPLIPIGEIFFRRPGPCLWKGKVLLTGLKTNGFSDKAYNDEKEECITYDKYGFRNSEDLNDWDIVVVGDSFVELGYLPHEELFTAKIEKLLGVKVKNLGVSYTGLLSYIFYVKEYGKSPATKHAIMVFFEGNDIENLLREKQQLQLFKETGQRPYRNFDKQTSFLKAVYRLSRSFPRKKRMAQNAYFSHGDTNIPISVEYTPPTQSQLSPTERELLDSTFFEWSKTVKGLEMMPWIVYMPCKQRVFYKHIKFVKGADNRLINWRPTDLPDFIKHLSQKNDIGFIDLTPALVKETQNRNLTYNTIWDTHLNRRGSTIVAEVIAKKIKAYQENNITHGGE